MHRNYTYAAFGSTSSQTGSTENSYKFAGEQFDEDLGDYYLRDRYYDSNVSRFIRKDVYEGNVEDPTSLHKYLYASGNPVSYTDPSGFITRAEAVIGIALLSILATELLKSSLAPDGFSLDYGLPERDLFDGVQALARVGGNVGTWLRQFTSAKIGGAVESSAESARAVIRSTGGRLFGSDESIQAMQSLVGRPGKRVDWLADYQSQGIALFEAKPIINRNYVDDIFSGTDKFSSTLGLMDDAYGAVGKTRGQTALIIFGENGNVLSRQASSVWSSRPATSIPSLLTGSNLTIEQLYRNGSPHLVQGLPVYLATP